MILQVHSTVVGAFLKDGYDHLGKESSFAIRANFVISSAVGIAETVSYVAITALLALSTALTFGYWKLGVEEFDRMSHLTKKCAIETAICIIAIMFPEQILKGL